ncbi:unnamed protein product [Amaranthus hypochondriacus]
MTSLKTTDQDFFLDCLYCDERCYDQDLNEENKYYDDHTLWSSNDDDEEQQLKDLFSKEEKTHFSVATKLLMEARKKALEWMIRVNSYHNFSVITLVLGVNYFDRFMLSFGFQKEMPWLTHIAAIACLSLASKIEETHVPLLLDFQVEHEQIFEAKVIQRMELLVLSTLEWKMNAVTPLSYIGHLIRKLKLETNYHCQILCRCESLILSAILDPRFLCYVPSVLAAATMVQTLKEMGIWSTLEHQNDIMDTLKFDKEKVEECYKFMKELSSNEKVHKRKFYNLSEGNTSPNNVLDVVSDYQSNESFNKQDSLSIISILPSPKSLPKKCRTVGPTCFG